MIISDKRLKELLDLVAKASDTNVGDFNLKNAMHDLAVAARVDLPGLITDRKNLSRDANVTWEHVKRLREVLRGIMEQEGAKDMYDMAKEALAVKL